MLPEHDGAVLTVALPDAGLEAGDVGTVVHVYHHGQAYEIELITS